MEGLEFETKKLDLLFHLTSPFAVAGHQERIVLEMITLLVKQQENEARRGAKAYGR